MEIKLLIGLLQCSVAELIKAQNHADQLCISVVATQLLQPVAAFVLPKI